MRWDVVNLANWGPPQNRKRLVIIASCPGEILPQIPPPTHSSTNPALLPLVSVDQTLSSILHAMSDNTPIPFPSAKRLTSWDGQSLSKTITTSGGLKYHPSGTRCFTLGEFAALQGFSNTHVFRGNHKRTQVGNAVPPSITRVLFESIKRDLDKVDGIAEGPVVID